jgi:hypothetical protein
VSRTHLEPGAELGPYRIVGHVGDGGMGQVYRAKDFRLGRDVALKVLPPDVAGDHERRGRMEREARAMGMLNHPNVVTVFDIGEHDGAPFIVSELLEGRTLRQRIADADAAGDRVPVDEVQAIVTSVADALGAAHGRGIVHRDIKPENIFLTSDGRTKVLDFGIAKVLPVVRSGGSVSATVTATGLQTMGFEATEAGVIVGTLGYMAPEQIRGETAAAGADVYACGVVAYELLMGMRPFGGASQATLIGAVLHESPSPLTGVPGPLGALVLRCLAKRAEDRYHDGAALAKALRGVAAGGGEEVVPLPAAAKRRPMALTAGVLLAVVVTGAAWWASRGTDAPPPTSGPASDSSTAVRPAAAPPAADSPASSPAPAPTAAATTPPAQSTTPARVDPPAQSRTLPAAANRGATAVTAPVPSSPPASEPVPAVLPLDGAWTWSEQVIEDAKSIECEASGTLRVADKDGLLDGTLQLRQECTDRTRATSETTNATTPLTAGSGTPEGVSFVTRHLEDGLSTTCRYTGRILGGRRAMAGDVTCDARVAGAGAVLSLRGTWRATRAAAP